MAQDDHPVNGNVDELRAGRQPRALPTPRRRRWRTVGLLALLVIIALALPRHGSTCAKHPPPGLSAADARFWVASAVADTACPTTGRAVYGLKDGTGQSMVGLDPVPDPQGGYLGVYGTRPGPGGQVILGRSGNLTSWKRVGVLDAQGASTPSLQPVPGGYLLAYAKVQANRSFIRVDFFRSLTALLAAHEATSIDLPLRLSGTGNGAPSFLSVVWNGSLRRSRLTIAFDYAGAGASPEREGVGVLSGFRSWTAQPDGQIDQQLDHLGLNGDHGQERQFVVAGRPWRIYEAQDRADSRAGRGAGWRVVLDDLRSEQVFALKLGTVDGTFASSFGKPVARVLPAPGGGQNLVVSLYVFGSGGTRSEAGELLYWTPIG